MYRLKRLDEPIKRTDYWYNTGWIISYPSAWEIVQLDSGREQIHKQNELKILQGVTPVVDILYLIGTGILTEVYKQLFIYEKITHTPRGNKYVPREEKLS